MILPLRHGIISAIINCVLPHLFSTIWCRMTKLSFVLSLLFEWCLWFLAILCGGGDEEEGASVIFYTCPLTKFPCEQFPGYWGELRWLIVLSKVDRNHNILTFYIKELCPFQSVITKVLAVVGEWGWMWVKKACQLSLSDSPCSSERICLQFTQISNPAHSHSMFSCFTNSLGKMTNPYFPPLFLCHIDCCKWFVQLLLFTSSKPEKK